MNKNFGFFYHATNFEDDVNIKIDTFCSTAVVGFFTARCFFHIFVLTGTHPVGWTSSCWDLPESRIVSVGDACFVRIENPLGGRDGSSASGESSLKVVKKVKLVSAAGATLLWHGITLAH
uniref:Uncharacterized protein n=1 Tax=Ditylenchus dipsaci TaxID=166011 RepID=A0A915DDW7_9BILA